MKIILLSLLLTQSLYAYSLKSLAQTSNLILVLSDRLLAEGKPSKKNCNLTSDDISRISQKLKIEVDAKIITMEDPDFKIIQMRANKCELDCTCDVYGLALEKKEIKIESLNPKATTISLQDREKCVSQLPTICEDRILKILKK